MLEIVVRPERPCERREVEELTRAAFWNVYRPGCCEHYLLHVMRGAAAFIRELDYVAECGGRIAGHIAYTRSKIALACGGAVETATFGPLSVLPEFQRRGIGGALVRRTLDEAAALGFRAAVIYGDPAYYSRFGFEPAENFGIRTADGLFAAALLARELASGALRRAEGRFVEDGVFNIDLREAAVFDETFAPMEKLSGTPSQKRFEELAAAAHD